MGSQSLLLLILEDEAAHAQAIVRSLAESDPSIEVRVAHCLREYFEALAERSPDIALLDLNLPDGNKMEALNLVSEDNPFPVLVMTSCGNEDVAVAAMKAGALDYLVKSPEMFAHVSRTVNRVLREWNLIKAHKAAEALQRDVLNSLPARIAVLDKTGKILAVNEPWMQFARAEGALGSEKTGVDANYLEVCRSVREEGDFYVEAALAGLLAVLSDEQKSFTLDYPCVVEGADRWFSMDVLRATGNIAAAIVSHTDITMRKRAEDAQRHLELVTKANLKLKKEVALRQTTEAALHESLKNQAQLADQALLQREQLRMVLRQTLNVLGDESSRISQELNALI